MIKSEVVFIIRTWTYSMIGRVGLIPLFVIYRSSASQIFLSPNVYFSGRMIVVLGPSGY